MSAVNDSTARRGKAMKERAFYCKTKDNRFHAIIIADSASKSKYAMLRSAKEYGYKYGFADYIVVRSPEHDVLVPPFPCSRMFPRNSPITKDDPDKMRIMICGCGLCRMVDIEAAIHFMDRISAQCRVRARHINMITEAIKESNNHNANHG